MAICEPSSRVRSPANYTQHEPMTERLTPETDAVKFQVGDSNHFAVHVVHAKRLERERDEALEEIAYLHEVIRGEWPEIQAEELIKRCKQ